MKFELGQTVATPAALEVLGRHEKHPLEFLMRHVAGDWGDVCKEDWKSNDSALNPDHPQRVLSSYNLGGGDRIWIITEWDRSVTTVLLPSDY